jgi:hypothetical protein
MALANRLSPLLAQLDGAAATVRGLYDYYRRGEVSQRAWSGLLDAFCRTNGRHTETLKPILRWLRPPRAPAMVLGALGAFSIAEQKRIAQCIAGDGFYIFESLLPPEICDEIENFAKSTPARPDNRPDLPQEFAPFEPSHPTAHSYRFANEAIVTGRGMQRLMADAAFLGIAETYLQMRPVIGGTDLWWSVAFGNGPGDEAAQIFHFDFDAPPAWLKLFVYLNDVDANNGPHIFIRGSHLANHPAAATLRARGYQRISDEEITQAFGYNSVVEIKGKRGTVFFADTRGFHKGKMPNVGVRLLAQMIYCHPAFANHGARHLLPPTIDPELAAAIARSPDVFERYC